MDFKPTWLYIKRCSHCELLYFGKTIKTDPVRYSGSGVRWQRHLKKHNAVAVHVKARLFKDQSKCIRHALRFSKEHDIIDSPLWANCVAEDGIDGGVIGLKLSKEARTKISATHKGVPKSEEQRAKMSANHARHRLGLEVPEKTKNKISKSMRGKHDGEKNPFFGRQHSAETKELISRMQSGKNNAFFGKHHSDSTRAIMSQQRKGRPPANKGVPMSEEQKQKLRGRFISDETRRKIGAASRGRKHSEESRAAMSLARMGANNHMYGKPSANRGKKWHLVNGKRVYYEP